MNSVPYNTQQSLIENLIAKPFHIANLADNKANHHACKTYHHANCSCLYRASKTKTIII